MNILRPNEIIVLAEKISYGYLKLGSDDAKPCIDVNGIYEEVIYPQYGEFRLIYGDIYEMDKDGKETWAFTDPIGRVIVLDEQLKDNSRFSFTLAHEFKHVIDYCQNLNFYDVDEAEREILEKDADLFAVHLLMPKKFVKLKFKEFFKEEVMTFRGTGDQYINKRPRYIRSFKEYCWEVAAQITNFFSHVSAQSLSKRLSDLGLIENIATEEKNDLSFGFAEHRKQQDFSDFQTDFAKNIKEVQ
ncbi:MAG: ImmA/IrrE family metallo-endopeptidase [Elusimicrobia bacterium]|nr:ImmA/IrrE family metallo-endopeptidase [Elusimicrobiota bacterium]